MFELKIKDEVINLKWGTWAMKLFCDINGLGSVDDFFPYITQLVEAGGVEKKDFFSTFIAFIMAGYQAANKVKTDEETVCQWIDELGGITKVQAGQLGDYFNYIVECTLHGITPLPSALIDEKKKDE